MRLWICGVLAAWLLPAAGVLAAEWPAVLREAEERCAKQHASYQDITIVQDMVTNTPEGSLTAEQRIYQSAGRTRMDMLMALPEGAGLDSLRTVTIDTGTETWMINPFSGKKKLEGADALSQELPHDCWGFTAENSRVTGEDTAQGRPCYLVALLRDSATHTLWLDKESLQVVQGESQDDNARVRWALSDFRPVTPEYRHPYKVEVFDGDQLISTMTVREVTVNQNLADALFNPDNVELQPLDMQELLKRALEAEGMDEDSLAPPDSLR